MNQKWKNKLQDREFWADLVFPWLAHVCFITWACGLFFKYDNTHVCAYLFIGLLTYFVCGVASNIISEHEGDSNGGSTDHT